MYTCIGKQRTNHGAIIQCANTSKTPSVLNRPEWGFLCHSCANARPNGRPHFNPDLPDLDKPNAREIEPCEQHYPEHVNLRDYQENEQEELLSLQELDLI